MLHLTNTSSLRGSVTIPGDKSVSHRAVMFGAIAQGTTHIRHFLVGADCLSTIDCFRRLGVEIEILNTASDSGAAAETEVIVQGRGLRGLVPLPQYTLGALKSDLALRDTLPQSVLDADLPDDTVVLDTGNSGTTTRIISGILAGQSFTSLLFGDDSINQRPMKRVMTPLSLMGADICSIRDNGCAPLLIRGSLLHGISYDSPVASAQVKSAILCAGLYADAPTAVTEPAKSRDHTERMLSQFGAQLTTADSGSYRAEITPAAELYAQDVTVPGDISSAAYFIAAALIVPESEVLIRGVGVNPTRAGILKVAEAMGADITCREYDSPGEPVADLLVRSSSLHGITIEGDIIPTLIDELPVIAVMAACAEGTTIIRDAAELKVKESNRIETVTENLIAMGVSVTPTEDGMIIEGRHSSTGSLRGARIHAHKDHRIAMSFAVAALVAEGETVIDDETCVSISYPSFFADLQRLKKEPV